MIATIYPFDPRIEAEIWTPGSLWHIGGNRPIRGTPSPWRPRTPPPAAWPPSPRPCSRARARGTCRTWPGPSPLWTCGSSTRWGGGTHGKPWENPGGKAYEDSWNRRVGDFMGRSGVRSKELVSLPRKMTWGLSRRTWWFHKQETSEFKQTLVEIWDLWCWDMGKAIGWVAQLVYQATHHLFL